MSNLTTPGSGIVRHTPLEMVDRPTVDTAAGAHYLNRRPQTLRCWACREDGPLRPIRINGRLAWPVAELRRLLNGGVAFPTARSGSPAAADSTQRSQTTRLDALAIGTADVGGA